MVYDRFRRDAEKGMTMRKLITITLAGLALSAADSALAEDPTPADAGAAPSIRAESGAELATPSDKSAPSTTLRGFDQPKPALVLDAGAGDSLAGLAPGQDLIGDGGSQRPSLAAADRDSYFATREYQDKSQITVRGGSRSVGKQFAGAGKAAALNLAIQGVGALVTGGDDN